VNVFQAVLKNKSSMTIIFHDFIKAGVVMTGILTDNAIVEMICNTNNDCGINEIEKFT
jgi:hypothetical protein